MTQEENIDMARQAGFERLGHDEHDYVCYPDGIEAFAKLVAEKEREACIAHAMTFAEKAIDVAIKLEREACAKEAERTFYSVQAAENIRARGKE